MFKSIIDVTVTTLMSSRTAGGFMFVSWTADTVSSSAPTTRLSNRNNSSVIGLTMSNAKIHTHFSA